MRQQFLKGFFYWWRGWGQLRRSRALGFYAVLPFLLSVVFFAGVFWVTVRHLSSWTSHTLELFLPSANFWADILHYPLWLTLFLISFLALIYLSYLFHVLLCGPFYSLLAERALKDLGKRDASKFGFSTRMILTSVIKAALFFSIGLSLVLFSFVPIINVIGLIFVLMILAFDTMDYSFEAMGMNFRQRLSYFGRRMPLWLGMASSLALTLAVPGLTLLILPGAVVGAAMIADMTDASVANS